MRVQMAATAAAVMLAVSSAYAGPVDEAAAVMAKWLGAFNANDAEAIVKLYAADATVLGTLSPNLASTPESVRGYFAPLSGSGSKAVLGEHKSVALGNDAALSAGFYEFTFMRSGAPIAFPARFTFVVEKRGSEWLIVHHHSSQRPKPPQ